VWDFEVPCGEFGCQLWETNFYDLATLLMTMSALPAVVFLVAQLCKFGTNQIE
jgi:hypothetical protein